jgi:negative regulator of flagellin synthesis FlgM
MAINFDNVGSNPIRDQSRGRGVDSSGGPASDAAPSAAQPRADRVDLSAGAKALRSAAGAVANLPAVDASRVDAIRQAISEGRYHVDPVRLAQKFLELENDL